MSARLWDSRQSQFCHGCGLYHWRDECVDVYFNDPSNWDDYREEE